jgi:hypothetical protein
MLFDTQEWENWNDPWDKSHESQNGATQNIV